jgi:hypothetical protein
MYLRALAFAKFCLPIFYGQVFLAVETPRASVIPTVELNSNPFP